MSSPNAKGAGVAALDPVLHKVVLFGGLASVNPFGTWLWDGTDWTRASPPIEPPLTYYSSAAYDPQLASVIEFGGAAGGPDLNDSWAWNGTAWSPLSTSRTPSGRESCAMAYDSVVGHIVIFGGQNGTKLLNDTWVLVPR